MPDQPAIPPHDPPAFWSPTSPWSPAPYQPEQQWAQTHTGPVEPPVGQYNQYAPTPDPPTPYDPLAFNRRRLLIAVGSLLFAATIGAAGVAFGYHEGKTGSDEYYQPKLAALQDDKARSLAAAGAIPNLATIAKKYPNLDPMDVQPGSLAVIDLDGDPQSKMDAIRGFMTELGFSSAVIERLYQTRALDGTITAQGHNCNVSWTYHPKNGLQLVFEAKAS